MQRFLIDYNIKSLSSQVFVEIYSYKALSCYVIGLSVSHWIIETLSYYEKALSIEISSHFAIYLLLNGCATLVIEIFSKFI